MASGSHGDGLTEKEKYEQYKRYLRNFGNDLDRQPPPRMEKRSSVRAALDLAAFCGYTLWALLQLGIHNLRRRFRR
jgi:hypothetical protein